MHSFRVADRGAVPAFAGYPGQAPLQGPQKIPVGEKGDGADHFFHVKDAVAAGGHLVLVDDAPCDVDPAKGLSLRIPHRALPQVGGGYREGFIRYAGRFWQGWYT